MKITEFFVGNFGIFSGAGARLSKGLTIFQGENESGKTTLMNFFRRVLFSREKHGRLKGNPYDPVNGGKHGGSARIRMEDGREYILSLDGTKNYAVPADGGTSEELAPDFFSINRDVYESVFAMGLTDMQSLDPLNAADVAARFFSAGAGLGSASLPRLLAGLEARQNEIYRPGGNARSVARVNRLLASLGETDARIRELREVNGTWRAKKDALAAMECAMAEKKAKAALLKIRLSALEPLEKGRSSWTVLGKIEEKLVETAILHPFPEDGLSRLERLKEEKNRIRGAIARTEKELRTKEEEKAALETDPLLGCLYARDEVEALEQESERFRSSLSRRALLEKETGSGEKTFLLNLENLCPWWTEDHLSSADVSAEAIDYARKTAGKKDFLERKKGEGEKSLAQWNRLREDRRSEAVSLEKEMSAVEIRAKRASERWELITALRGIFAGLCDEEDELMDLEETGATLAREKGLASEEAPAAPGSLISLISAVLLAVGGGAAYQAWLTSDPVWTFGAAALFSASLLAFMAHRDQVKKYDTAHALWKKRMDDLELRAEETVLLLENQKTKVDRLRAKREELGASLGGRAPRFESEMEALFSEGEEDNSAHERFAVLSERSRQMSAVIARMDSEGNSMENDVNQTAGELEKLMSDWRQWLFQRQFDQNLAPRDMEGLVPRILQLRSEKEALEARKSEMKELDDYIALMRQRILDLSECFATAGVEMGAPPDSSTIRSLVAILRKAGERKSEITAIDHNIQTIRVSSDAFRNEMEDVEKRSRELFAFAGVDDEEGFRALAARWREKETLLAEKFQERKVLLGLFGTEEALLKAEKEFVSLSASDIRKEREEKETAVDLLEKELETLADTRGRLALEVEQIASDERLGELLFARKELERKMDEEVREWLSVVLARRFLEFAKEKHERERQPEVIRRAGKYLALMTGNGYTILSRGGEKGLSVVLEGNGPARERKEEVKWSSGLADQVYLSMRLALATLWGRKSEPLPLILDDLLVRFDETRQRGAAEAIFDVARENQVLLFTCQKNTLDIFKCLMEERGFSPESLAFHRIERGAFYPAA